MERKYKVSYYQQFKLPETVAYLHPEKFVESLDIPFKFKVVIIFYDTH